MKEKRFGRFEVRDIVSLSPKSRTKKIGRFEVRDIVSLSPKSKLKPNTKSSPKSGIRRLGRFEIRDISPVGKLKITKLPNSGSKKCFKVCL